MTVEEKLDQFYNNWRKKHGTIKDLIGHNLYYIETKDREGNTTGEAYALNTITSLYMKNKFGISRDVNQKFNSVYIGDGFNGTNIPGPNDYAMFHNIAYGAIHNFNSTADNSASRACIWDPIEQVLYFQGYLLRARYDYVISGHDTPFDINEIGISSSSNPSLLALHAIICDENGEFTTITKNPNEELYIEVHVRYYNKPQYMHEKMKSLGNRAMFAMDPWALWCRGGCENNEHSIVNAYAHAFIRYPIASTNNSTAEEYAGLVINMRSGKAENGNRGMFTSVGLDNSTMIASQTYRYDNDQYKSSYVMENKSYYLDMAVALGNVLRAERNNTLALGCVMGMAVPIKMNRTEEIANVKLFVSSYNKDSFDVNFGWRSEGSYSAHGLLPIVDFRPTSITSYNGITHDWDIVETISNQDAEFSLTSYFLYAWVLVRMRTGISGIGDAYVTLWFNHWPDQPVTSFDRNLTIYASNAWWDPSTWIKIDDPYHVTQEAGSKSYFMTFGGHRTTGNNGGDPYLWNSTNVNNPLGVFRDTTPKPGMVFNIPTTSVSNVDVYSGTLPTQNSFFNPIAAGIPFRRHIVCESKGYIWMSNSIYYPELGISHPITSQYCTSLNANQMIPSMRYTEPTGKRILQIFRANNAPVINESAKYVSPKLSKVSVFDIGDDPTVPPHEYVIELGSSFPDTYNVANQTRVIITSTERGHVVFCNISTSRVHIVDLMGNQSNNYEPYNYILTDPTTGEEVDSTFAFAIQYTNYVIYGIKPYTGDRTYAIIDLTTQTEIARFTIPLGDMSSVQWIRGWKNYIYFVLYASKTSLNVGMYNLNEPDPDLRYKVISTDANFAKAMIPGGGFLDGTVYYWEEETMNNRRYWMRVVDTITPGDEHCFFVYKGINGNDTSGNNANAMLLYYIDEDHPDEPLSINTLYPYNVLKSCYLVYQYNTRRETTSAIVWHGLDVQVGTFNEGKQRIAMINFGGSQYDSNYPWPMYFDLNYLRDNRTAITRTNDKYMQTENYAWTTNYNDANNCGKFCANMYKGKILLCEYDTSDNVQSTKATITYLDPNRVVPHTVTGTTRTIQVYNDPKKIYGNIDYEYQYINSTDVWGPPEIVEAVDNPEP